MYLQVTNTECTNGTPGPPRTGVWWSHERGRPGRALRILTLSRRCVDEPQVLLALLYALYGILGMQIFGSAVLQDTYCNVHDNVLHTGPLDERYYCKVGLDNMAQKSYGSQSGGAPGQMLIGLNRQYTHHASFQSFFSAMCLLWQCATGQDWKFVMCAAGMRLRATVRFGGRFEGVHSKTLGLCRYNTNARAPY